MTEETGQSRAVDPDANLLERIRWIGRLVRRAVRYGSIGVMTAAWGGFWLAVARLHYLSGRWIAVLVTGTIALGPAALAAVWFVRTVMDRRPVAAVVPDVSLGPATDG